MMAARPAVARLDRLPLRGKRILVTRPAAQAPALVDRLHALGGEAIVAPTIRIEPPADYGSLDAACARLVEFDWVVFTSVNGVDHFMARLLSGTRDAGALKRVRVCAVGPATAARLARYGLRSDLVPDDHRAEGVVAALRAAAPLTNSRILLPRGDLGRTVLPDGLRAAGAIVSDVTAYRTVLAGGAADQEPDVARLIRDRTLDMVTFTSASALRNLVTILGTGAADLLNSTAVAVIGPVTAAAARERGITVAVMPPDYTVPALVAAIAAHYAPAADCGSETRCP